MSFAAFHSDEKQDAGKVATAGDFVVTAEDLSALQPDHLSSTALEESPPQPCGLPRSRCLSGAAAHTASVSLFQACANERPIFRGWRTQNLLRRGPVPAIRSAPAAGRSGLMARLCLWA